MERKTVYAKNFPYRAIKKDIRQHFCTHLGVETVEVGPLVPYFRPTETITEDLKGKVGDLGADVRIGATVSFPLAAKTANWKDTLRGKFFRPAGHPPKSINDPIVAVKDEFDGLLGIEQDDRISDVYTHQFEIIFVHSVEQHPFETWTYNNDHDTLSYTMWPRDLLSRSLKAKDLFGRYSTLGYPVDVSIDERAQYILNELGNHRLLDDVRPMYFVCHRDGASVLFQALNFALHKRRNRSSGLAQYEKLFVHSAGHCLVKGIVCFEPGDDAPRYDATSNYDPAVAASVKSYLKVLTEISSNFATVRKEHDIPVINYHSERRRRKGFSTVGKLLQGARSSKSSPGYPTTPFGLDVESKDMVKFASDQDPNYKIISGHIHALVKSTLPTPSTQAKPPPILRIASGFDEDTGVHYQIAKGLEKQLFSLAIQVQDDSPPAPLLVGKLDPADKRRSSILPSKMSHLLKELKLDPENSSAKTDSKPRRSSEIEVPAKPTSRPKSPVGQAKELPFREKIVKELVEPLRAYNTVFILDDSKSMQRPTGDDQVKSRWEALIEAMEYLADVAVESSPEGVDVNFVYNTNQRCKVRSASELFDVLTAIEIEQSEEAPLHKVVRHVLDGYLAKYRQWRVKKQFEISIEEPKRLNLIIVTDGCVIDQEDVESAIVRAARNLPMLQIPQFHVGIEFLQVGNDPDAERWLNFLDDMMVRTHGIRDICDKRYFDKSEFEKLSQEALVGKLRELLLGSIDDDFQGFIKKDLINYWEQ